ncbi:thrombospondin type 3 repeat-containing protein [Cellulophaga baltica]|uniref:Secretion system C-terminal sorting domain-containing protein n=1 Tax=Cellulophaga baltica 18 TaxID=1348584 RepID=A0AAU8RKJ4_9FLAO|nr:thrombospondin type 3 repeat-containing protein [Cellulophaga baltica]AIZ42898.1 hypothetical protein M666_15775 [Cellulophaga baltica 18]
MKKISFLIYFLFFFQTILQSQILDASLLELKFSNDGYPEKFTKVENGFFFSSEDDQLWFSDGLIENTYLVKDFESGTYDDITSLTPVGRKVFFVAENGSDNRELWVSDGTGEGTIQLTDRNVNYSTEGIYNIIEYNGKVYFGAYSETYGNELWVSDGTSIGTFVLKDISESANSSPKDFFVFNNKLIFKAITDDNKYDYWSTDGTELGTVLLKNFQEDSIYGAVSEGQVIYNGNFYFFANNGVTGYELWKSDGTTQGTQLFKEIYPGNYNSSNSMNGLIVNNKLLFFANDGVNGNELWKTDGTTEGTSLFKDLNPGSGSGIQYNGILHLVGDLIYFTASDGAEQSGLWVTDGTEQGTIFLNSATPQILEGNVAGTHAVYFAYNENYKSALWKSDGTPNGTNVISEDVEVTNISVSEQGFLAYGDRIFFNGNNKANGNELWVTDVTSEGTKLFFDVNHRYGVSPSLLTEVGDQLFFRGNNDGYYELCVSDGTIEGTNYLPINPDGQGVDDESEFINFNGKLVVSANDGVHGYELWISDGTKEGTKMIKDINTGSGSSMYNELNVKTLTVINNRLYFIADDGIYGSELWTSDGTESGTYRVTDIAKGVNNHYGSYPQNLVLLDDYIYFSASDGTGSALYKTNGTESGTNKIINLNRLESISVINNKLVMIAETSGTSYGPHDLWVSDGTAEGTNHLMSFGDGIDSNIQFTTVLNDELYFVARFPYNPNGNNERYGKSIFKTNGTLEGTIPLFVGSEHPIHNPDIDNILTCGDYVYFGIQESLGFGNKELWRTSGALETTIKLVGQEEGEYNSVNNLACFKDNLIFTQYSSDFQIWITNGQPDKVIGLNFNISNGSPLSGSPFYFTSVVNKLYFEGTSTESGSEIYVANPLRIRPEGTLEDNDEDGVIDLFDECTETPSGESVNDEGCSESQLDDDEDGISNELDECPETPMGEAVNSNGCSESDLTDEDKDGVNNNLDLCPNTPLGESVDENGCSQSQLDDDVDGVMNNLDICPETLPIYEVDNNGCPVLFELPSDNFTIEVTGVSCVGKNNGKLSILAEEPFNYTATIDGDEYTFSSKLLIQNLYSGSYNLCITIEGELDFQRCFNLIVESASEISGKSTTSVFNDKVSELIEIDSGTPPYIVSLNDKDIMTTSSLVFNVDVSYGDTLKVSSKFECEGVLEKDIVTGSELLVYPNPTMDLVNILIAEKNVSDVVLKLFDSQQRLLSSKKHNISNGKVQISIADKPSGVYFIKLELHSPLMFKIIKQ